MVLGQPQEHAVGTSKSPDSLSVTQEAGFQTKAEGVSRRGDRGFGAMN